MKKWLDWYKYLFILVIILVILSAFFYGRSKANTSVVKTINPSPVGTQDFSDQIKIIEIDKIDKQIQAELRIIDSINGDKESCSTAATNALNNGSQTLDQYKAKLNLITLCYTVANTQIQAVMDKVDSLEQQRAIIVSGL